MANIDKTRVSGARQAMSIDYDHAFAITPSDTDVYDPPIAVYVGGAGNLAVVPARTDPTTTGPTPAAVTLTAVPVGTTVRLRVTKVMATNTTATLLVGLC